MLSFFPRGVLDEILNLIESVSEDFPSFSCSYSVFINDLLYVVDKCSHYAYADDLLIKILVF